jgi:hypothetical protein
MFGREPAPLGGAPKKAPPKVEHTDEGKWPSPMLDPGGYAAAVSRMSIEKTLQATGPYWEALIAEMKETNRLLAAADFPGYHAWLKSQLADLERTTVQVPPGTEPTLVFSPSSPNAPVVGEGAAGDGLLGRTQAEGTGPGASPASASTCPRLAAREVHLRHEGCPGLRLDPAGG